MKQIIVMLLCCLSIHLQAQNQASFRPTDPAIGYVGRTYQNDRHEVSFDWVGVYFRFMFTGTSVAVRVSDTKSNHYNVFLDGTLHKQVNFKGQDTIVYLCQGLENGTHELMVHKRTEGREGKTTLHELLLDQGASLFPIKAPERRIAFIGNSITCGFGVDTNSPKEKYTPETENCYHSYASITARHFGADYVLTAHSGIGVVHNYGDRKRLSDDHTMRHRFDNTFDNEKDPKWDFTKWQAHAVVISLGTNDFSQSIKPSQAEFVQAYIELISSVRKVYGNVPLFCLTSPLPMPNTDQYDAVKKACESVADSNIYFIPMLPHLLNANDDLGAAYHPSYRGQQKIAMLLIPYIASVMNWSTDSRSNLFINIK